MNKQMPVCHFSRTKMKSGYHIHFYLGCFFTIIPASLPASFSPVGCCTDFHCNKDPELFINLLDGFNFPGGTVVKKPPANAGDAGEAGWIPRSGRSPGVGNGNPLQDSCLGNPTVKTEEPIVLGVAKSGTGLSD